MILTLHIVSKTARSLPSPMSMVFTLNNTVGIVKPGVRTVCDFNRRHLTWMLSNPVECFSGLQYEKVVCHPNVRDCLIFSCS